MERASLNGSRERYIYIEEKESEPQQKEKGHGRKGSFVKVGLWWS